MNKTALYILAAVVIIILMALVYKMGQNSKSKQVKSVILEAIATQKSNQNGMEVIVSKMPGIIPGITNDLVKADS